jgi:hypothetical protein
MPAPILSQRTATSTTARGQAGLAARLGTRALADRAVEAHLQSEQRLLADLSDARRKELASLLRELLLTIDARYEQ